MMVQLPGCENVAAVPDTLQTESAEELNATGKPEVDVADKFNVFPTVCFGTLGKLTVCA